MKVSFNIGLLIPLQWPSVTLFFRKCLHKLILLHNNHYDEHILLNFTFHKFIIIFMLSKTTIIYIPAPAEAETMEFGSILLTACIRRILGIIAGSLHRICNMTRRKFGVKLRLTTSILSLPNPISSSKNIWV